MNYIVRLVPLKDWLVRLEPLFRRHYAEMTRRLESLGLEVSPYNPRVDKYLEASIGGWLLTFVLEVDNVLAGYSQIYLTNDMHNRDSIAKEDTIYVLPEYRNGCGRLLARAVHQELRARGVKRLEVTTATDLRVSKWLERMGYKHTAHCMTLVLEESRHVRTESAASA